MSLTPDPAWLIIVRQEAQRDQVLERSILGRSRKAPIVKTRHRVWWRIRNELKLSYPVIGRLVQRDHTTVISGVKRAEALASRSVAHMAAVLGAGEKK